jgi:hypothetical protein
MPTSTNSPRKRSLTLFQFFQYKVGCLSVLFVRPDPIPRFPSQNYHLLQLLFGLCPFLCHPTRRRVLERVLQVVKDSTQPPHHFPSLFLLISYGIFSNHFESIGNTILLTSVSTRYLVLSTQVLVSWSVCLFVFDRHRH